MHMRMMPWWMKSNKWKKVQSRNIMRWKLCSNKRKKWMFRCRISGRKSSKTKSGKKQSELTCRRRIYQRQFLKFRRKEKNWKSRKRKFELAALLQCPSGASTKEQGDWGIGESSSGSQWSNRICITKFDFYRRRRSIVTPKIGYRHH